MSGLLHFKSKQPPSNVGYLFIGRLVFIKHYKSCLISFFYGLKQSVHEIFKKNIFHPTKNKKKTSKISVKLPISFENVFDLLFYIDDVCGKTAN